MQTVPGRRFVGVPCGSSGTLPSLPNSQPGTLTPAYSHAGTCPRALDIREKVCKRKSARTAERRRASGGTPGSNCGTRRAAGSALGSALGSAFPVDGASRAAGDESAATRSAFSTRLSRSLLRPETRDPALLRARILTRASGCREPEVSRIGARADSPAHVVAKRRRQGWPLPSGVRVSSRHALRDAVPRPRAAPPRPRPVIFSPLVAPQPASAAEDPPTRTGACAARAPLLRGFSEPHGDAPILWGLRHGVGASGVCPCLWPHLLYPGLKFSPCRPSEPQPFPGAPVVSDRDLRACPSGRLPPKAEVACPLPPRKASSSAQPFRTQAAFRSASSQKSAPPGWVRILSRGPVAPRVDVDPRAFPRPPRACSTSALSPRPRTGCSCCTYSPPLAQSGSWTDTR